MSATALAFVLSAQSSGAQDAAPESGGVSMPDEIYVTARRKEERLQDVPVAVTALNAAMLERQGIQRVEDLQRVVPGMQATPSARGDNSPLYMIRGQRGALLPSSIVDSSIGMYFDEFNLSRSVGTNQSLFDLQSVQVLKGPQGTLFGRNSTGGAILITPNKPSDAFEGYVKLSAGNYDYFDTEAVLNFPIVEGKIAIRGGGKISQRDGYLTNVLNGQKANDKDSDSYRVSFLLTPTEDISSNTIYSYYQSEGVGFAHKLDQVVLSSVPIPPARPAFAAELAATQALGKYEYRNPTELYAYDETTTIQNSTSISLGEVGGFGDITLKNILGFRKIENQFVQDFFGGGLDVYPLFGTVSNEIFSEEFQVQGVNGNLEYILGAYYFNEEGFDTNYGNQFSFLSTAIPARFPINNGYLYDYENTSLAGFFHVSYDFDALLNGLSVSAGVRYTDDTRKIVWHNQPATDPTATAFLCTLTGVAYSVRDPGLCSFPAEISGSEITYNVSIDYQISDNVLTYLAHRRGYRAGGFNQTPDSVVPKSFEPEYVDDLELGFKSEFVIGGWSGRFNAAGHYQWYSDIQRGFSTRQASGATTTITANAAKAHIYGTEVELLLTPSDYLEFSLSHAYTEAVYDEWMDQYLIGAVLTPIDISDSKFALVPEHQVNLSATAHLPVPESLGEVSVSASYYYQSSFITTDVNTRNCGPDGLYRFCTAYLGELPSYDLINMRVDWMHVGGQNVNLALFVNNLTDDYYTPFATNAIGTIGVQSVAVGAPRMWGIEIKVPFGAMAE